jgi:hypothetical protein
MKFQPLILALITVCSLAACNSSSTDSEYDFRASAHIAPDSVYSNTNHKLELGLVIQTPARSCWAFDFAGYGRDSDTVRRLRFTYVTASIKKLSSSTCPVGLDTVRARLTIPFDSAGSYYIDFPQVDSKGFLIQKRYQYTVQ